MNFEIRRCLLPLSALAAILTGGCSMFSHVPANEFQFGSGKNQLRGRWPKDMDVTNLVACVGTNGTWTVSIGALTSRNNADLVLGVATQNAQVMQAISQLGAQAVGTAAKAFVKP